MPLLCLHHSKRQRTALLKHKLQLALTLHFVTLRFETGKFSVNMRSVDLDSCKVSSSPTVNLFYIWIEAI